MDKKFGSRAIQDVESGWNSGLLIFLNLYLPSIQHFKKKVQKHDYNMMQYYKELTYLGVKEILKLTKPANWFNLSLNPKNKLSTRFGFKVISNHNIVLDLTLHSV